MVSLTGLNPQPGRENLDLSPLAPVHLAENRYEPKPESCDLVVRQELKASNPALLYVHVVLQEQKASYPALLCMCESSLCVDPAMRDQKWSMSHRKSVIVCR